MDPPSCKCKKTRSSEISLSPPPLRGRSLRQAPSIITPSAILTRLYKECMLQKNAQWSAELSGKCDIHIKAKRDHSAGTISKLKVSSGQ